jgi:phage gp46-like protein
MASPLWDVVVLSNGSFDWAVADPVAEPNNNGGLQSQDDLGTAIILCLFTDAEIPQYLLDFYDVEASQRGEWHGNTFGIEEGEGKLGSNLHRIERMQLNEETLKLAIHYAAEAVQILVANKFVTDFSITGEIIKEEGRINLLITAHLPDKSSRNYFADLFPLQ